MNSILIYVIPAVAFLVMLLITGLVMARLYKRAEPDRALIRTGVGGRKIIKDGGAFVFPAFHQLTPVNMQSVPITVKRSNEDALITGDSMRVDMTGDFVVRVGDDPDQISRAAQTLGNKTYDIDKLRELIEGKVVDAARAVAATLTMQELHAQRSMFVQKVQDQLSRDLESNGLVLETVSLTSLDQTNYQNLNPNNAFNAVAMTNLQKITSENRKKQAEMESEADIVVAEKKNLSARRQISLEQEIATEQSNQAIVIAESRARQEEAEARAREDVTRATELAVQERKIAVAERSKAESEAQAEANKARALAIEAEESVKTAAEVAHANRTKQIAVLKAEEEAESNATEIRVRAKAEREAAEDRAQALLADAEAKANSQKILAEAEEITGMARARAKEAMVAADNSRAQSVMDFELRMKKADILPSVVEQMMRPAEKIDSIRIFSGHQGFGAGEKAGQAKSGSPASIQDAILDVALNKPMADAVGKMLAVDLTGGVAGIMKEVTSDEETSTTSSSSSSAKDPDLFTGLE